MTDGKHMRMSFDDGTHAHLAWPENITLEQLEFLEEVIALQLKSVRKAIERRKAEAATPPAQSGTAGTQTGEQA
jgi:hypothetical protein